MKSRNHVQVRGKASRQATFNQATKPRETQPATAAAAGGGAGDRAGDSAVGKGPKKGPPFPGATALSVIQFQWFHKHLERLDMSDTLDALTHFRELILFHPGFEEEARLMSTITESYYQLFRLTSQNECPTKEREATGNFDEAHEDAVFYLWDTFLEGLLNLREPRSGGVLPFLSAELEGVADLVSHHPALKREVKAMRAFVQSADALENSKVLRWEE